MEEASLAQCLRRTLTVGTATVFLFFGIFGGWAALFPLAKGALAPGNVSPDGSRRTVQHLEGGIIHDLPVREGDRVKRGDVIAVLQDVRVHSEFLTYKSQLLAYLAEQDRLVAEQKQLDIIVFGPRSTAYDGDPELIESRAAQQSLFEARGAALAHQKRILIQRIKQLEQQIEGLKVQNNSVDRQAALIGEEVSGVQVLFDKGLERKPRLLELQREQAKLEGTKGENIAAIARAEEAIGEAELEILRLESDRLDEVSEALADLPAKISEAQQGLRRSSDALERTLVKAPIDGTVMNLRFKTVGGVVKAGDEILDVVPARERLVIDARIPPLDIDVVYPGLVADVVLTAYPRRSTPTINARVEWVSADINKDEQSGETYYLARVVVESGALAPLGDDVVLYPGMPTEVMIKSGERTPLEYLLEPLLSSLRRSFTES